MMTSSYQINRVCALGSSVDMLESIARACASDPTLLGDFAQMFPTPQLAKLACTVIAETYDAIVECVCIPGEHDADELASIAGVWDILDNAICNTKSASE